MSHVQPKKHKTRITVAWLALAITGALSSIIIYWSLIPFGTDVIELKTPIVPEQQTIMAGQIQYFTYTFCKNWPAESGTVSRYLNNSVILYLPTIVTNVPVGCATYTLPVEIPNFAPSGTYTYNTEVSYRVNPIKTSTYYFQSEPFNVIGKE
jgi:ABC-type phosphate transport system permease subunit